MNIALVILAGLVGGLPAIVVALIAQKSAQAATRVAQEANQIDATKAWAEVHAKSQQFYGQLLADMEKQNEHLRLQSSRKDQQLVAEQEVSDLLRGQVRAQNAQLEAIEATLERLHLDTRLPPPPPPLLPTTDG